MKNTENFGLGKPESDEYYDVEVFNNNADIVDAELKKHSDKINNLSTDIEEVKTSFQTGCDTIVAGCTAYGSTPASNSPEDIVASIGTIYEERYNQGAESAEPTLQSKSATLKTTAQTIKADSGYDGLSQVTVPAVTGTASTANVLAGKTFNSATAGIGKTGTMTDNGAVAGTITTSGGTYTIPEGYHNGSGKVTGATLASLVGTNVTLTSASKLLTGNTAYGKNGTKYTGTMANKAGTTVDASAVSQDDTYTYLTIPANGYYSTASKIRTENCNLSANGTLTASSSTITKVKIGFKPKYFTMICNDNGVARVFTYNADLDDNKYAIGEAVRDLATSASAVSSTNGLYFDGTYAYLYIYKAYPCYWFAVP